MNIYACIDLKSFYASVECVERNLDPLTTNLVVADKDRTEKTICLAVTPSLKEYNIKGRSRLFEVVQRVKEINNERFKNNNYRKFNGVSFDKNILTNNKSIKLDYIIAPPRMSKYIKYSNEIYKIYLKYISKDDILVYSIDEVFIDITSYLNIYKLTPKELITKIIHEVYEKTGITATAGIGTNMYLAKVAMDIVAKKMKPDEYGVRISEIDEISYKEFLWDYKPISKFWRIGPGISKKLEENNMYTMGDIALVSINNEDLLYKLFGINAELIIDHAWGYEPCTIKDVKNYKPKNNSISTGQVLHEPYNYIKTKTILKEMCNELALSLTKKNLKGDKLTINIGYDISNLTNSSIMKNFNGIIVKDYYGRSVPKPCHGTINIDHKTNIESIISSHILKLYDKLIDRNLLIRRINITMSNLSNTNDNIYKIVQYDIFNYEYDNEKDKKKEEEDITLQKTMLDLKDKYGKNILLKGIDLLDEGNTIKRNNEIGGHKSE